MIRPPVTDLCAMTDLADSVETLKREVAVPGTFATTYPNTTDDDLLGSLEDAFAAAQLDGFFGLQALDLNTGFVTPNLSMAGAAVVAIYAAERILVTQIMNLKSRVHYEAGPVKYEVEQAATVLTTILKGLQTRKDNILSTVMRQSGATFDMADLFSDRVTGIDGVGTFLDSPVDNTYLYLYELA